MLVYGRRSLHGPGRTSHQDGASFSIPAPSRSPHSSPCCPHQDAFTSCPSPALGSAQAICASQAPPRGTSVLTLAACPLVQGTISIPDIPDALLATWLHTCPTNLPAHSSRGNLGASHHAHAGANLPYWPAVASTAGLASPSHPFILIEWFWGHSSKVSGLTSGPWHHGHDLALLLIIFGS